MHPVTFWLRLFRGYFIELEDHIRWLLEIQEHSTIWASTSLTTWLPLTILIGILTAVGGSSKRPLIVSWPSALDPCLHLLATMSFMRVYIYTYTHTCTHSYSYTYYIVMYLYIYIYEVSFRRSPQYVDPWRGWQLESPLSRNNHRHHHRHRRHAHLEIPRSAAATNLQLEDLNNWIRKEKQRLSSPKNLHTKLPMLRGWNHLSQKWQISLYSHFHFWVVSGWASLSEPSTSQWASAAACYFLVCFIWSTASPAVQMVTSPHKWPGIHMIHSMPCWCKPNKGPNKGGWSKV